jgi:hypothetical protein
MRADGGHDQGGIRGITVRQQSERDATSSPCHLPALQDSFPRWPVSRQPSGKHTSASTHGVKGAAAGASLVVGLAPQ